MLHAVAGTLDRRLDNRSWILWNVQEMNHRCFIVGIWQVVRHRAVGGIVLESYANLISQTVRQSFMWNVGNWRQTEATKRVLKEI